MTEPPIDAVPFSVDRSQSRKPVKIASSEAATPPMNTNVPARKKSRAHASFRPNTAMTSKAAARMYAVMGKSVRGGCVGLPDPRVDL
jgi:hypothetical protein